MTCGGQSLLLFTTHLDISSSNKTCCAGPAADDSSEGSRMVGNYVDEAESYPG